MNIEQSKQVMVFRHSLIDGLGSLEVILQNLGYEITYIDVLNNDQLNSVDPLEPNLLIVLGASISVNDNQLFPFINIEKKLLKQRLDAKKLTLGICYGAQLMANACGADVYAGKMMEVGWQTIQLTNDGENSPLRHFVDNDTHILNWHQDTFSLPADAVHLASSTEYANQAFAIGNYAIGLQFHPEITAKGIESWFMCYGGELPADYTSIAQIRQDTTKHSAQLTSKLEQFMKNWLNSAAKESNLN